MKLTYHRLIGLSLVFLLSCSIQKEYQGLNPIASSQGLKNPDPALLEYWEIYTAEYDGSFRLTDSRYGQSNGQKKVHGNVYKKVNGKKKTTTWGEMEIGDILLEVNPAHGNNYEPDNIFDSQGADHLIGGDVIFRLKDTTGAIEFEHTLYVPEKLLITHPANNSVLGPGDVVMWNPDPKVSKKNVLIFSYSPIARGNEALVEQGFDESIEVPRAIPDNGSYTIKAEDFEAFPDGAVLDFRLLRGSIELVESQIHDRTYRLAGYSDVSIGFKMATD